MLAIIISSLMAALLYSFLPRGASQSTVQSRQVVCLSVTLKYRDHTGWNSSKIISRLGRSLSANPNSTDRVQGEHPEIVADFDVDFP